MQSYWEVYMLSQRSIDFHSTCINEVVIHASHCHDVSDTCGKQAPRLDAWKGYLGCSPMHAYDQANQALHKLEALKNYKD